MCLTKFSYLRVASIALALAVLAIAAPARSAEMAYVDISALKASVPNDRLTQSLDDNGDGAIDNDVWSAIQEKVQTEIDGVLGQRYTVPFPDLAIPAVVKHAAYVLAIEAIYDRRNLLDEKSPERINAKNIRTKLSAIADGDEPLTPGVERARPSGTVVAEPSRTHSCRPAI
jgi:phage gp36-like protein